ncbi:MAG: DedA family protein [Planctomycetota bacterium]
MSELPPGAPNPPAAGPAPAAIVAPSPSPPPAAEAPIRKGPLGWPKRLLRWTLAWAESAYASWALFWISCAEAAFFPSPPDVLLIPMCLWAPKKAFRFATNCTIASVLGGCLGYLIGTFFWEAVGHKIFTALGYMKYFDWLQGKYNEHAFLWVAIAGLTPIPYKVFTIMAGVCSINFFPVFIVASVLSRGARFFAEATLIYFQRDRVKWLLEKYLEWFMTALFLAGLGGYLALQQVSKWLGAAPPPVP